MRVSGWANAGAGASGVGEGEAHEVLMRAASTWRGARWWAPRAAAPRAGVDADADVRARVSRSAVAVVDVECPGQGEFKPGGLFWTYVDVTVMGADGRRSVVEGAMTAVVEADVSALQRDPASDAVVGFRCAVVDEVVPMFFFDGEGLVLNPLRPMALAARGKVERAARALFARRALRVPGGWPG